MTFRITVSQCRRPAFQTPTAYATSGHITRVGDIASKMHDCSVFLHVYLSVLASLFSKAIFLSTKMFIEGMRRVRVPYILLSAEWTNGIRENDPKVLFFFAFLATGARVGITKKKQITDLRGCCCYSCPAMPFFQSFPRGANSSKTASSPLNYCICTYCVS